MRVDWVHPSWRDLVIAQLASDPPARRHFLHRCGVYGVTLSLSTAGGTAGERRLPLLLTDADWDALTDCVHALLPELDTPDQITVLLAIGEVVGDAVLESASLARVALGRLAGCWDATRAPIPLVALSAWFDLAHLLDPAPMLPSLSATLAELLPVTVPALDDRAELDRFADWLLLCTLLGRSASYRRWLTAAFGTDQIELVRSFVGALEVAQGVELSDPGARILDLIPGLIPPLARRASMLSRGLRPDLWRVPGPSERTAWPGDPAPAWPAGNVRRVLADL